MKRKKFIALLCVAATSASLVTPVMAEENQAVETVQETAVEVPVEEGAEEKEIPAENPENETSEATNTVDTYTEDGLYEENGEVYYYKDGTIAIGERTIGGKKYWFTSFRYWIR